MLGICRIGTENYAPVTEMMRWRESGERSAPVTEPPAADGVRELSDPDLRVYAALWDRVGVRLYVNVENPGAQRLYEGCGFLRDGTAHFMEKCR